MTRTELMEKTDQHMLHEVLMHDNAASHGYGEKAAYHQGRIDYYEAIKKLIEDAPESAFTEE